jgi:cytochrome P450
VTATIGQTTSFDPDTEGFNPFAPGIMDDPYPSYRVLRDRAPVHFNEDIGLYFLSRYDDVSAFGRDRQNLIRGTSTTGIFDEYQDTALYRILFGRTLFGLDEPDHGRLKRLIAAAFTRSRVEGIIPTIERICAQLLDEADLQPSGRFELVSMLGHPLPFLVICEFLGIPGDDRDSFLGWARNLTPMVDPFPSPEVIRRALEGGGAFEGYLTAVLSERRRLLHAGATLPPGLISDLVEISEHQGEWVTAADVMCLSVTVLVAGFENVTNLISNTVRALAENPDQLRALRDDPALFANLADEALRYYSTTQYNLRQANHEIKLHGVTVPQGAHVILLRGAANRDERHFPDPDTFDLRRPNSASHVGFGEGATFCTGAMLTRAEVRAAFQELLKRLDEFHISRWERKPVALFWGPRSADIQYASASRLRRPAAGSRRHRAKLPPQDPQGVKGAGERGAFRDAQPRGRLASGQVIQVDLLYHIPVSRTKSLQRMPHMQGGDNRIRVIFYHRLTRSVLGHLRGPRPAHADLVHRDVVRDPDQPASYRSLLGAELGAVPPRPQHRLLDDVLSEITVLQQTGYIVKHEGPVVDVQPGD